MLGHALYKGDAPRRPYLYSTVELRFMFSYATWIFIDTRRNRDHSLQWIVESGLVCRGVVAWEWSWRQTIRVTVSRGGMI